MTSEKKKIIDALRCCHLIYNRKCEECPYEPGDVDCTELESNAITLVERMSEENEKLQAIADRRLKRKNFYKDRSEKNLVEAIELRHKIERMSAELEQVKNERNAAVRDLKVMDDLFREDPEMCCFCKYAHADPDEEPCKSCNPNPIENKWQWHGVCFENSGGDANAEN